MAAPVAGSTERRSARSGADLRMPQATPAATKPLAAVTLTPHPHPGWGTPTRRPRWSVPPRGVRRKRGACQERDGAVPILRGRGPWRCSYEDSVQSQPECLAEAERQVRVLDSLARRALAGVVNRADDDGAPGRAVLEERDLGLVGPLDARELGRESLLEDCHGRARRVGRLQSPPEVALRPARGT